MNYWQNYPKFMVVAAQGRLGQGGDEGERLRLRVAAEGRRQLLVDVHLRRHVPRQLDARRAARSRARRASSTFGMNPVGLGPELRKMDRRAVEAEVARRRRERRDRDRRVLEGAEGVRAAPDASKIPTEVFLLPAARLRGEGRHVHQLRALDAVEVEGARSAGPGEVRPGDRSRGSSSPCATSTRRKAARSRRPSLNALVELHQSTSSPISARCLKEINGKALADIPDPEGQDEDR